MFQRDRNASDKDIRRLMTDAKRYIENALRYCIAGEAHARIHYKNLAGDFSAIANELRAALRSSEGMKAENERLREALGAIADGNAGNFPACVQLAKHVMRDTEAK